MFTLVIGKWSERAGMKKRMKFNFTIEVRQIMFQISNSLHPAEIQQVKIGAGGGTRTRTTFYSPRILSPVRLPFRHTG
jgi:hypothetical protein